MIVHLDFETFSRADLRAGGAWKYAADPSTEILCFAWSIDTNPVNVWCYTDGIPADILRAIASGAYVHAWSANFERAISESSHARKIGFPVIPADRWRDTQALAAMCALPLSLGACAAALNVVQQKDTDGKRLLRLFSMPQRDGSRILPADRSADFALLREYCAQDVRTECAVAAALPIAELPAREQAVWLADSNINRRGVRVDVPLGLGCMRIQAQLKTREHARLKNLTNGQVTTAGQRDRIIKFIASHKVVAPTLTKDSIPKLLALPDLPAPVRAVLEIRLNLSKASAAKYAKAVETASPTDERVRGVAQYHAATTGRWAGRMLQLQNLALPKTNVLADIDLMRAGELRALAIFQPDVMGCLRDAIRHIVIARPDHVLNVCDLSSIEARVLGWLADEPGYLKAFREGLDLYKVAAASIFGVAYDDVDGVQRQLGKVCILALGYGMGFDTFLTTCRRNPKLADISEDLIRSALDGFRRTYARIVQYWYKCERAAVGALSLKRKMTYGRIAFEPIGKYLTILLPSGRRLWYPDARVRMRPTSWGELKPTVEFSTTVRGKLWLPARTYGGRIVENIVQAVARDILAGAIVECERQKLPVVLHVHDEIVTETREPTLDKLQKIMTTVPAWADGLPLDAHGFSGTTYRKD